MQSLTYTATMNADLARVVGVPAAFLYNIIVWLSGTDMAEDYDSEGWVYVTSDEFERRTTFKDRTFTTACKALVDAGLVEMRKSFIKGSIKSVNHFRLLSCGSAPAFNAEPDCAFNAEPIIEDKKKKNTCAPAPKVQATQPAVAPPVSPSEKVLPFDEKTKEVSVRPDDRNYKNAARRRAFAVAREVRAELGLPTNKIDPRYAKAVADWLEAGLTAADIITANRMLSCIDDEYHKNLTPLGKLSANNRDWYIQQKNQQDKKPKGAW